MNWSIVFEKFEGQEAKVRELTRDREFASHLDSLRQDGFAEWNEFTIEIVTGADKRRTAFVRPRDSGTPD